MMRIVCGCGKILSRYVQIRKFSSANTHISDTLSQFTGGEIILNKDEDTGIAHIILNQPQRKNAFSGKMMVELRSAVEEVSGWSEGKGLLIYGRGSDLCAGGDLNTMKPLAHNKLGAAMSNYMHHTLLKLVQLPMLTCCVVHGRALGGGAELTAATDFRLFTSSASVTFVQARMGVVSGWGGGTLLARLLGYSRALDVFMSCDKITAGDAQRLGFSNATISDDKYLEESEEWLKYRTRHPHKIIREFKNILLTASDNKDLQESLRSEREIFAPIFEGGTSLLATGTKVKHNT